METFILDPLPFEIDPGSLMQTLRVREGSTAAEQVRSLIADARGAARPRAVYRLVFSDARGDNFVVAGGQRFTSRVLAVNLAGLHRFFAFVATSGRELEAWAHSHDGILERFYADTINQAVLHSAMQHLVAHLSETYRLAQVSMMNPGSLTDWPLGQQRPLFALLGDVETAIGVTLTDSLLMVPTKSVSGIIFPTEETFASCQLCPRPDCPNRRAAYDPTLFERRFGTIQEQA